MKVGYDRSETILRDDDARKGVIFFDGFKIINYAQTRYPQYKMNQACFANILRSEHIPFNFKDDRYRQIRRNQTLGESMTRKNHPDSKYEYFTSIILYPEGNDYYRELVPLYKGFLTPAYEKSFMGITYESFIDAAAKLTEDTDFLRWLRYLEDRYIVRN